MSIWNKLLYFLRIRRRELTSRLLNQDEEALARQVFQDQLPYGRISIANFYLPGNEAHKTAVTVASGTALIPIKSLTDYTIYFGPDVFRDGAHLFKRNTFIHELTHVWQGHHGTFSWDYMVESMIAQGRALIQHRDRNKAYEYDLANLQPWDSYNVEQQAIIVEGWFENGMSESDPRYVYIRDNIRAGRD
ncbi:MAG TPA: hypothetical protein VGC66_19575 [Pyrinomonadaceae bacterium]|jgi:hypothetical protein